MDALLSLEPAPWSRAARAGIGVHAELDEAELTVSAETRHPQIGAGAHVRVGVRIPRGLDPIRGALRLNLAETREDGGQFLGAWCAGAEEEVAFVTFLPAADAAVTAAGQLRYRHDAPNDLTYVDGNTNANTGTMEFQIALKGIVNLSASDFIL